MKNDSSVELTPFQEIATRLACEIIRREKTNMYYYKDISSKACTMAHSILSSEKTND